MLSHHSGPGQRDHQAQMFPYYVDHFEVFPTYSPLNCSSNDCLVPFPDWSHVVFLLQLYYNSKPVAQLPQIVVPGVLCSKNVVLGSVQRKHVSVHSYLHHEGFISGSRHVTGGIFAILFTL